MLKRLAAIFVPVFFVVSCGFAQVNEVSITAGRTFIPTQTLTASDCEFPPTCSVHFGDEETVAFNYARFLMQRKIFGLYAELPVAIMPRTDLNTATHGIPEDIGALFVTPSARVNIFAGDSVTPWFSVGGGYGRWRQSSSLEFYGSNPGPTGTNTGVFQVGGGLDVWFWQRWGGRFEFRDFYSGKPDLNLETTRGRQHNFYVGVGITHRF